MEINGQEFAFCSKINLSKKELFSQVFEIVYSIWPNCRVEIHDNEMFIYDTAKSFLRWDQIGWTENNPNTMIYCLYGDEKHYFLYVDNGKDNKMDQILEQIKIKFEENKYE